MTRIFLATLLTLSGAPCQADDYRSALAVALSEAIHFGVAPLPNPAPPTPGPTPNRVPRSKCQVCKGLGYTLSGDGIVRIPCANCYDDRQAAEPTVRLTRQVRVDYCDGRRCWPSYHTDTKQVPAAEVAAHTSQGWRVQPSQ